MQKAWNTRMAPYRDVRPHWTGNEGRCRAGGISDRARRGALRSLNFVRALGGLEPVSFNATLSAKAQKAALIMEANDALSHFPDKSWRCWTRDGYRGAGKSNLGLSWPYTTAGGLVEQYMDDWGSNNTAVGHRRWIMYPFVRTMGVGMTDTANALYVLGPIDYGATNPSWVAWPTAGYFPSPLEPGGRWSFSSGRTNTDFSRARVSVKRGGTALAVRRYSPYGGYGQPALVFEVKGVRPTGTYKVAVTNIRGAGPSSHRYTVRLFQP